MTARARVRAPELVGKGGWLNTGGKRPHPRRPAGKIVLLDFWTFCCINCLHVLDELRPLEEKYRDVAGDRRGALAEVRARGRAPGAWSPPSSGTRCDHPVLDDPELATWKQYAVRAWPTLVVDRPRGVRRRAARRRGARARASTRWSSELEAEHEAKGTLRRGDGPVRRRRSPQPTRPALPGEGASPLPGRRTSWSPTPATTRWSSWRADGETWCAGSASGERGLVDGDAGRRAVQRAAGAVPAAARSRRVGYDVVVADTVNHALRGVGSPTARSRRSPAPAGSGCRARPTVGPGPRGRLSSPWDVAWFGGPGLDRDGRRPPAVGVRPGRAGTVERRRGHHQRGAASTGRAAEAWFAQPSGLGRRRRTDGRLWVADSETSALRCGRRGDDGGRATPPSAPGCSTSATATAPAGQALLQHPLGRHRAARRLGRGRRHLQRRGAPLRPGDRRGHHAGHRAARSRAARCWSADDIVVVESAAHRLTRLRLPEEAVGWTAVAHRTQRAATEVAAGRRSGSTWSSRPRPGQKLDDRYGPSTRLLVCSTPPELLLGGAGGGHRPLPRAGARPGRRPRACCTSPRWPPPATTTRTIEYPACHVHQQDWGVPVRLTDGRRAPAAAGAGGSRRPG